jgi:uncharacterized delta-60 repeat protein
MAFSWLYKPNRAMRRVAAGLKNISVGVMAMGQKREAIRPRMRVLHQFERLESRLHLNAADLDPSFGVGGTTGNIYNASTDEALNVSITQPDGKVLVGMRNFSANEVAAFVRYLPTGQLDSTFGNGGKARYDSLLWQYGVDKLIINDDGSILASGFPNTNYGPTTGVPFIQRFTANGVIDPTWVGPGSLITAEPAALLKLTAGKCAVVAGGNIYRLNADGSPDTSFGAGGKVVMNTSNDFLSARFGFGDAAIQPDGKIVVVGSEGVSLDAPAVRRFLPNGQADNTFGTNSWVRFPYFPSTTSYLFAVQIQADGKILTNGNDNGYNRGYFISRLMPNGAFDKTLSGTGTIKSAPNRPLYGAIALPDGSILASGGLTGQTSNITTQTDFFERFLPDGTPDAAFGNNGIAEPMLPDSWIPFGVVIPQIAADGSYYGSVAVAPTPDNTYDAAFFHVKLDGSFDDSFGTDGYNLVDFTGAQRIKTLGAAVQPDGKLLVSAYKTDYASDAVVARFNVDGSPDVSFGTGGIARVDFGGNSDIAFAIALQPDGKILLAGRSDNDPLKPTDVHFAIARINPDGSMDATFGNKGISINDFGARTEWINRIAIASDGTIYAGGLRQVPSTASKAELLHYLKDGTLDQAFGTSGMLDVPVANGLTVSALQITRDGGLLLGGPLNGGTTQSFYTVHLNSDGSLDTGFGNNGTFTIDSGYNYAPMFTLLREAPEAVNGRFYAVVGTGAAKLIVKRFLGNGTIDTSYGNSGTGQMTLTSADTLNGATITPSGQVIAVGTRRTTGTKATNVFLTARLNAAGQPDASFGTGAVSTVNFTGTGPLASAIATNVAITDTGRIDVVGTSSTNSGLYGVSFAVARLLGADGVPPTATGTPDATGTSLTFTFSEAVVPTLKASDLVVQSASHPDNTPLVATTFAYDPTLHTGTFTFSTMLPPDTYHAVLPAAKVANTAGLLLDGNGDGTAGDDMTFNFLSSGPLVPRATITGASSVHVSWTPTTNLQVTGYRVERSTDGINFVNLASVDSTTANWDDSGVATDTLYIYRVQAYQLTYNSAWTFAPAVIPLADIDNSIYLQRNIDGIRTDLWINAMTPGIGIATQQVSLAQIPTLSLTGGNFNDTLTLDFSNGNPLPPGGISFDGGAGVNTLAIIGTPADDTLTATASGLTFSNKAFGNVPINVANLQTIQFHGGSGGNDAINITGGNYTLDADTPTGTPNVSVTVGAAGMVTFTSDQHLAGLAINDGHVNVSSATRKVLEVNALSLTGNAVLDVNLSDLLLGGGTPSSAVAQYLKQGYGSGTWNGPNGIISTAATNSNGHGTLGYAVGGDPVAPVIGAGQTLVRYTLPGDATLDGLVDIGDLNVVLSNYLKGKPGTWVTGDFTYAGQTDITDLNIVLSNYLKNTPATLAPAVAAPPTTAPAAAAAQVQTGEAASIPPAPLIIKPVGDPPKRAAALAATITPMVATPKPPVARKGTGRSTAAGDKLFSAVAVREELSRDASLSVGSPSDTVLERVAGNSGVLRKLNRRQPWHKGT